MGHDVFLSYSTKDKQMAEAVCTALERKEISVWMAPRNILPGSSYASSIINAIESARIVVLIFSSAADDSPHVEREIEHASDKRLQVIPFRVEDIKPKASLAYFIGSSQYLDAFAPPIERHFDRLAEVVKQFIASPSELDQKLIDTTIENSNLKGTQPPSMWNLRLKLSGFIVGALLSGGMALATGIGIFLNPLTDASLIVYAAVGCLVFIGLFAACVRGLTRTLAEIAKLQSTAK
jgi:hypothetical protein